MSSICYTWGLPMAGITNQARVRPHKPPMGCPRQPLLRKQSSHEMGPVPHCSEPPAMPRLPAQLGQAPSDGQGAPAARSGGRSHKRAGAGWRRDSPPNTLLQPEVSLLFTSAPSGGYWGPPGRGGLASLAPSWRVSSPTPGSGPSFPSTPGSGWIPGAVGLEQGVCRASVTHNQ